MGRPRQHQDAAARVAAHRAKHDLVTLSVDVPRAIVDGIEQYMRFKNLTKAQVIAKLVTQQLMRKR